MWRDKCYRDLEREREKSVVFIKVNHIPSACVGLLSADWCVTLQYTKQKSLPSDCDTLNMLIKFTSSQKSLVHGQVDGRNVG